MTPNFLSNRLRTGVPVRHMVIVAFVGVAVLAALGILVVRLFAVSSRQASEEQRVEEARYSIDRLQETIRNVRNIDCNGDGSITNDSERWAQVTEPYRLVVFSNVDEDAAAERVRYEVIDDQLVRVVGQAQGLPCAFYDEAAQVVATSVYARSGLPLFAYLDAEGRGLAMPAATESIRRIAVRLLIHVAQSPESQPVEIVVDITPRLPEGVAAVEHTLAAVELLLKRVVDPVSAYASSVTVEAGEAVELQWQGKDVQSCTASWTTEPVPVTGTVIQQPMADETFVVVCQAGTESLSATAQVMVQGGACHCSDWMVVGCDESCGSGQQRERRSCAPALCAAQTRCVPQASCETHEPS